MLGKAEEVASIKACRTITKDEVSCCIALFTSQKAVRFETTAMNFSNPT
jgi:hypothetical protein